MTATIRHAAVAAALIVALGGCGAAAKLRHPGPRPTAAGTSPGVSPNVVRVIMGWSDALRMGHIATAAHYFRIPSVFFDGSDPPIELHTRAQVEAVNAALPCGARFLSARTIGSYVNALFRLTNRSGPGATHGCGSGLGQTARTNFLIRNGQIVQWLRAADEPGDNGSPKTGPPAQTTPGPVQEAPNPAV